MAWEDKIQRNFQSSLNCGSGRFILFSTVYLTMEEISLPHGRGYVIDNYIFVQNSTRNGKMYLRCKERRSNAPCFATASILNGERAFETDRKLIKLLQEKV